jgi:putative tricarboxylic transport membrane protein
VRALASSAQSGRTGAWRNGRAVAGALGLLLGGGYLIEGWSLKWGSLSAPGPGIFPLVVGVLFALVSLGVMVEALFATTPGAAAFPSGPDLRRLVIVSAAFVAYVFLLNVFGFLLATALFVAFYCRVVGSVSWVWSLVAAFGVAIVVWLVFGFLLEVPLPEAIWS